MLTMYSTKYPMDSPWLRILGMGGLEKKIGMTVDVIDLETAQMPSKDKLVYQTCPAWEELIFVRCQYCNSSILPRSIKNHVEMRHTGSTQYEKDPEFSIFLKVKVKPTPPTVLFSTPNPRASSTSSTAFATPSTTGSRSSGEAFSTANQSPRLAEQYLGWPNSPHGAFQQAPINMTMGANIVRVKPEKKSEVMIPGYNSKVGSGVSVLAKNAAFSRNVQGLPLVKDEGYNQTFSFSCTNVMSMPSTSSLDMPSTSYEMPSTSRGLMLSGKAGIGAVPGFGKGLVYTPIVQSPSCTSTAGVMDDPNKEKEPKMEKLVLRRVLQKDQKASAEGRQSVQGLKGVTKNKKDSSQETYFMVVKNKDRQQNLMAATQHIRKQTNVVHQEKDVVDQKMKKLETVRNKLISKLFQELQNVKQKLDQCNRSKQDIERELLAAKANWEEAKRTTDFQTEALMQQNAKFENEIRILKQRNEDLTNSLEQAQIYGGLGNQAWDFSDNHMSKQFQAIEEQKLELQRRIEELECESRELKNSSTIERGRFDAKLRQYFKIISELKRRLDAQVAKSEELKLQRDYYEKHLPPEFCLQMKSQLASFQQQAEVYEVFPGLLSPQSTPPIASPAVPLAETLLADIQNINYITFQSQMSPESLEILQQQQPPEVIGDEEVS